MSAPNVLKPIWRTAWPPKVMAGNDAEERIARLQKTPRSEWTCEDWRAWAEFLERRGALLAHELNKVRALAFDLAAAAPKPIRRGPKAKPKPTTLAAGLLGLVRVPMPHTKKQPGRRVDQEEAKRMAALHVEVEDRMAAGGRSRESALREVLAEKYPRRRRAGIDGINDLARRLSRKLSRSKPAR